MKRIVWSISLLILLLNTLWIPLTYAEEYAQESEKAEVIGDIPTDDVVENDEGEEQSPQFPVNENFDNDQEPEIDPVDSVEPVDPVENPTDPVVPVIDEWSWGTVEEPVNPDDDTLWSWWNQWDENSDNFDALSWGNQEFGSQTWESGTSETDFSGGNTESSWTGWSSTEDSEDEGWESWIISTVTSVLQDFLSTIRFFFVSDDNDYIKESKINWIETITLEDPENWEIITIMDRNLWAEDNDIQSENSYGYYYQWWNNNGFEEVNDSNVTSLLAVYSWKYEWIGYTRDNKFRVGGNDIWEEDEEWRSNYDELWYLGENEEIQWPCPEGYHVPSDKEWNKLVRIWTKIHTLDENEWWKTVRSVKWDTLKASLEQAWTWDVEENTIEEKNLTEVEELFMKELKLPKAGNYATNGEREDWLWIYWTRTPSDKLYQSEVFSIERYFWEGFDENLLNRANWNSVRCFLDTKDKEVVEYNKEEITWEETFDDVTVSVYAWTWFFPEGTKLLISPIVQEQEISDIKDKISEEDDNIIEDSKLVAFDISFIYRWEEVQPLEWKVVKVTFDYSNDDELLEADNNDEQKVKVFHIDDKDEEWNKVESWEEVVKDVTNIVESEENWIAVADAESFSTYLLTVSAVTTFTVHFDVNGWAWFDNAYQDQEIVSGWYIDRPIKDPYKVWYMFLWWFDNLDNDYRFRFASTTITGNLTLYAKWALFNDIVYCDNTDSTNCITLMDRNMWATTNDNTSVNSYWYYYQWWNNYGFYYNWWNNSSSIKIPNILTWTKPNVNGYGPMKWYYWEEFVSSDKGKGWTDTTNENLRWWASDVSSNGYDSWNWRYLRQWPCPRGYHVPSLGEIYNLIQLFMKNNSITNSKSWPNSYVWKGTSADVMNATQRGVFISTFYIPIAWRIVPANDETKWDRIGKRAPFWSSSVKPSAWAYWFEVKADSTVWVNIWWYDDFRGQWKAVRCFKDNDDFTVTWKNIYDTSLFASGYIIKSDFYVNRDEHPYYDGVTPIKEDEVFIWWYVEWDNSQTVVDLNTVTMDSNKVYVAKFQPTILTDYNVEVEVIPSTWGSVLWTWLYHNGDSIVLTWIASEWYQFSGWYDSWDNLITTDNPYIFIADESDWVELKAVFKPIEYFALLNFDTLWGSQVQTQTIIQWRTWTKPIDPIKDGYSFVWWYYTGLQIPFDFTGTVITEDITVYAKWNLVSYTITYYLNWWTWLVNTWIYTKETETFTLNNPKKLNYDFIWWSGTNLSLCSVEVQTACNKNVSIQQWSTWDRVYEAIYDCAYWSKPDWTCNIVKWEDWLIDYDNWGYDDLEVDFSVTDPLKIVIMDRNLWATISDSYGVNSYGLYYQWWNNYWFKNVWIIENASTEQVDAMAYWPWNYYVSDTFILQNNLGWDNPSNYNLWWWTWDTRSIRWNWSDEARQWPCPNGYHVPSILEWHRLKFFAEEWEKTEKSTEVCSDFSSKDQCVMSKLKLPRAGNIKWDGSFEPSGKTGLIGRYWSSSRYDDNYAYRYKVNTDWSLSQIWQQQQGEDHYIYYSSQWMSVRCFKNVSSKPIVYQLSWWVQIGYPTSTVVWWNDTAKTNLATPTRTGSEFKWWYLSSWYEEWTKVTTNMISDYSNNNTVTLYSKWECKEWYEEADNGNACVKNEYTVTITSNNEDYGSVTSGSVVAQDGVAITTSWNELTIWDVTVLARVKLSTPQYTYLFSGWNNTCGNELSSDCSIVAEFTRNTNSYTITFHSNGWSSVEEQIKEYWQTWDEPEDPTRDGYDFIGWYSDSGLTNEYHFTEVIEWNVDLYAKWSAIEYSINYILNEWSVSESNPETYTIESADITLNNPTKTGYTFIWWSGTKLEGAENKTVTIGVWSTWDRKYEANWNANKYQVTYKANGWVWSDVVEEVTYDEHYEFLPNSFVRTGYSFVEWNTKADGSWSGFVEWFSGIWKTTTWANLYAIWNENSYNVAYAGWEWTEGIVTWATYRYTEPFNLAANNFTKRGYSFSGWKNGDNHYAAGAELSRLATQNWATVTFTAEWNVVPYSITYKLNGWIFSWVVNPTTYDVNSSTINVGNPERVWYIFLWWTGTDLSALSSNVVITGWSIWDRTYYANWQARDDIKITVNHYLQDLDVDNTVLDTYSISWTVKEEWTADSTINVSGYKQTIEWYSFDSWKVDGSVVSTTTVSPDWSRVIDLFYTRNSYSYAITTSVWSSTEWSSSNGNYYYWAKIILSWDSNNDCFVWSGWAVQWATLENNMKQTSFIMPANDVTANSLIREKTYNIVFNGNSANSWSMSPINWIRCTQEVALPYNSFVKSGHTFTWWTDGEKQYANWAVIQTLTTWDDVTVEFTAIWDINYYPVVWRNYSWDVLFEEEFPYMDPPVYHWETPLRDADAQYTYDFEWWNPWIHPVTWAQVYTAVYTETLNEYTITWDVDWTKTMKTYKYWETPSFSWSKDKDPTEQYEYTFSWWSPEIWTVVWDQTYLATYTESVRKYPVYWLNYNWAQLELDTEVPYWSIPSYDWETPTRPSDLGSSYEFIWWNPTPAAITWVTYYRAVFSGNQNEYTITWVNYDNSTLEVDTWVAYWSMPSYDWVTPTKASDSQYDYEFSWWSPATWTVVWDQTYVASYTSIPRTYTVTWENSDGIIIKIDTWVLQWTQAVYSWDNPSSWSSAEYDYEFIWWNPIPWVINSDTTYTALYKSTKRKYLIRFVNGEIELQSWMVEYGVTPVYTWDTPEKSWDAQYSYNYVWWNPWISAVTWDITYEAKFDAVVNKYSVTFVNEDGSSVLKPAKKYDYWTSRENVEKPGNPTKPSDAQYDYEFLRWIPVVSQITWDVEFKATYTWTIRTYTVTWKNDDGTVLETDYNVPYWTTPSYNSATPTKQGSSQYEYIFIWWDPEISPVNWDITYTAQFSDTSKTYTITWKNGNTTLETDYNVVYWSIPSYDWAIPTKDSDAQYDYEFSWWNPATWLVVWDQTYVANFISKLRTYTVTWKNGDIVLETDNNVPYGTIPTYNWATPVKTWTAQYSYTFDKWTPDVGPISSDTIYNAIFKESINKYVVTWENDDGSFLDSGDVSYWETPVYSGPTPTKAATPQYTYTFSNHWDPEVTSVTTGAKYTAKFNSTVNKYTIKFVDWDGKVLQSGELEYGAIPEYTGADPTKTADAQYTYKFNNTWSPAISGVTWDLTYEAQFDSTVNKYTITWKDWDDKTLKTEQVAYGTTPSYDGETPTKTATAQYTYTFNNTWSPEVVSVTNNATYTAQFTETVNKYTIRFIDYDDSLIIEKQVDYWTTSWNYKPADPVREGYTFIWWSPSLETVTGPRTYKATYTINQYTVTPVVWTWVDRIEWWWKYDYGTEIVLTWYAKEWYHFEWWYTVKAFTVTVWPNSIDVRIHAIWNTYKVRFQPWEGEWTMDDQEFTYGLTWTLKANSFTRDGYTFTWWSDGSGNVYANKWKVYNLATWWILLFTALWKTWVVPPEPSTPSWWGAAAWWGRSIPTEDEHESADLQTWAIVQTWNDDVLSPDEIVKPDGHTITWTIVNTWGDSHAVTWYTTRTQEEMDAYKYAYKYHITTLAPKEAARPDEYVQRWHMAKMVVNYALNVLHRKLPEKLPRECRWLDWRNAWESQEIKDYAEKACALWIMWIDMKYFQPKKYVTRAQFWTIIGRLMWWKLSSKPYYAEHLLRLKERWIMTQIENPENRIEIRKWAWLMFMRMEKYFKVK